MRKLMGTIEQFSSEQFSTPSSLLTSVTFGGMVLMAVAMAAGVLAQPLLIVGVAFFVVLGSIRLLLASDTSTAGRRPGDGVAVLVGVSEGERLVRAELERSRRYEHSFCLVRVTLQESRQDARAALARWTDGTTSSGVSLLLESLRESDLVWSDGRGRAYGLLVETDTPGCLSVLERMLSAQPGVAAGDVRVAEFPTDGYTLNALQAFLDTPHPHEEGAHAS